MPREPDLNADTTRATYVDASTLDWRRSPDGSVLRRRFFRAGPPESGQVTSVVRYEPGSRFPPHSHPDGEEILVLDGVFSDEHGDWPAGTYLLNPDGTVHAPFSERGCVLFVKLRQYPGPDRRRLSLSVDSLPWLADGRPGIQYRELYRQTGYPETMRLERWAPDTRVVRLDFPAGAEIYVLAGDLTIGSRPNGAGSWIRLPRGSAPDAASISGATLYVCDGGLRYVGTRGEAHHG